MNAVEIYEKAVNSLERSEITLGEFEAQIAVLKDVEPVVRCKDCKHYMLWEDSEDKKTCAKSIGLMVSDPDDFCSYGKKREV